MLAMRKMDYVIGIQIRLYPNYEQQNMISKNDNAARFIYNKMVGRNQELFLLRKTKTYCEPVVKRIEYLTSLGTKATDFKANYPFLNDKDIDAQALAHSLMNYQTAWSNYHKVKGTSIPTFHKKSYEKHYQTDAHYQMDDKLISDGNVYLTNRKHIQLPKLGNVKFKGSDRIHKIFARTCESRVGSIKIWRNSVGEYYASLQIGSVCPFHKHYKPCGNVVGVDVNIENFYTDSNNHVVENPKYRKNIQKKLAKAQHKLSRMCVRAKKEKRRLYDAKNYQKQRIKTAKMLLTVARRRESFHDITSKRLIESQDIIFAENLKTKNLLKNHNLAFAISDCGWGEFLNKLNYKAGFYGRTFLKVPARNTTQTCSDCGYVLSGREEKLTLRDREWTCPNCGSFHLRDHNAAINIRNKGTAILLVAPI